MFAAQSDDLPDMTEAEYLAFAEAQAIKYEYRQGRVYAMTGASVRHNTIIASAIMHLGGLLADHDCTVTSSDTRIHIASKSTYRYPDITVFCGQPHYWQQRTDTLTNPVLLVEVLSPGTALRDYNEKLEEYTQIEALQAYILISQDTPKVEVYRRHESARWLYEYVTGLGATIDLSVSAADLSLSLAEIYRRVRWSDADEG